MTQHGGAAMTPANHSIEIRCVFILRLTSRLFATCRSRAQHGAGMSTPFTIYRFHGLRGKRATARGVKERVSYGQCKCLEPLNRQGRSVASFAATSGSSPNTLTLRCRQCAMLDTRYPPRSIMQGQNTDGNEHGGTWMGNSQSVARRCQRCLIHSAVASALTGCSSKEPEPGSNLSARNRWRAASERVSV